MKNDILNTLRELKHIAPDSEYTKHSRMLILAAPQHATPETLGIATPRVGTFLRLSAILAAGVGALVMILGGTTYLNETYSPLALEGLNQKSLTAEANEINSSIEITLGTIDYLDTSNQTTLQKISEISKPAAAATLASTATATPAETATTTMDAFLIKNDSDTASPADQINAALDKIAQ